MITAGACRALFTELFCDSAASSFAQAHELLVRLCRQLETSGLPANESVAKLINTHILGGRRALWDTLVEHFGADPGATDVPAMLQRFPFEPTGPQLDATAQQRVFGRALAEHREAVAWIYEVGMILGADFSADAEYTRWRAAEDRLQERVSTLAASADMQVLAESMRGPVTR